MSSYRQETLLKRVLSPDSQSLQHWSAGDLYQNLFVVWRLSLIESDYAITRPWSEDYDHQSLVLPDYSYHWLPLVTNQSDHQTLMTPDSNY